MNMRHDTTLEMRHADGWTDGKPIPLIRLMPSKRQALKVCKTLDELPTCGRVLWRQICKLPHVKGYGKQRFERDGQRGIVPLAQLNAKYQRNEWDAHAIRRWVNKQHKI